MSTFRTLVALSFLTAIVTATGFGGPVRLSDYIYGLQPNQPLSWTFSNVPPYTNSGGHLSLFWTLDNIPNGSFVPVTINIDGVLSVDYLEVTPHPWDYTSIAVGDLGPGGSAIRYWFEFELTLDRFVMDQITRDGDILIVVSSMGVTDPTYSIDTNLFPRNGLTLDRARLELTYNIPEPLSLLLVVTGLMFLPILKRLNHLR